MFESGESGLLALVRSFGRIDTEVERRGGGWVKSSMENLRHYQEAKKFSHHLSVPTHLEEWERRMRVEDRLMADAVTTVANELKKDCGRKGKSGVNEFDTLDARENGPLKVFGRATRGDSFFSRKKNTHPHDEEEDVKFRRSKRKKYCESVEVEFCPSVKDYFGEPVVIEKQEAPNKRKQKRESGIGKKQEVRKNEEQCPLFQTFVQSGADALRIVDKKYQVQNDAINAFMVERRNRRNGYKSKEEIVDKNKEFLVELTLHVMVNADEALGMEIFPSSSPTYKVEVLGSQTLADLRDALFCHNDYICVEDVKNPDVPFDVNNLAKNKLQSAMFLIDNTIFNDMRWKTSYDYASDIIRWTRQPPEKTIGPFKCGSMSHTKLQDLTLQFGFPYLFRHIGDCEHIIVFNKARLFNGNDEHRKDHFPRISWMSDMRPKLCRIDNEFLATWAVLDYSEFPENPMLVCTNCVRQFCFNRVGVKRGKFRLYPYRQLPCEIPLQSEKIGVK